MGERCNVSRFTATDMKGIRYVSKFDRADTPDAGARFGCAVCGRTDPNKPMCFRGESWCCDDHRKLATGSPN